MPAADASPERELRVPGGAEPVPPGRRALSDRLPRAWLFPLLVFAVTWLLILATWRGADAIYGQSHPWTWYFLFKDSGFYLSIAQVGYPAALHDPQIARTAFFPFFPLLIRLASYLTGGNYPVAGLIVSVLAGAASAVGVWALAARVCDRRVADRAVALYCFFPGAMTFAMLYSEPLSVALAAGALLALVNRRWLLAGIIGAAGTAERPTLIVLVAAAGIAAIQAI
jgi:Gpi18-like mannosyltransferase